MTPPQASPLIQLLQSIDAKLSNIPMATTTVIKMIVFMVFM